MKKIYTFFIVVLCILMFGICSHAEESPEIYNKGEKVELKHELIYYDKQYYIHSFDLSALNLLCEYDESSKRYIITTNDYFGQERRLYFSFSESLSDIPKGDVGGVVITPVFPDDTIFDSVLNGVNGSSPTFIINPDGTIVSGENGENGNAEDVEGDNTSESIIPYTMDVTYSERAIEKIGRQVLADTSGNGNTIPTSVKIVEYCDKYYFPIEYIGKKLSHKYSFNNNRFNFYITDKNRVIIENTINLFGIAQSADAGWSMDVYYAGKVGEGDDLSDFNIMHQINYASLPDEDEIHLIADIPKEKITDETFYYILDLGERYTVIKNEYNFSNVGIIDAYPYQKDINYTAKISLPDVDIIDVAFTVGIKANGEYYEQSGVIKSGETSSTVEITHIPLSKEYYTYVAFDINKYVDVYIDEIILLDKKSACDFYEEYTAHKSKEIKCNISLPDGFICAEDVEIKLSLGEYNTGGASVVIVDRLKNGNDSVDLILNSENPSAEVVLYGNSRELKLYYTVKNEVSGLKPNGYLGKNGWFTQYTNYIPLSKLEKIIENSEFSFHLLENREIVIREQAGEFVFEKTNVNFDVLCDVYIVYYDENGAVISSEKDKFVQGRSDIFDYDISNQKIKKVKAFAWEERTLRPLGKAKEIVVNQIEVK